MTTKKGQAAMEFLMTYGWAILATVIIIGAMWYFWLGPPATQQAEIKECISIKFCEKYQADYWKHQTQNWDEISCTVPTIDGEEYVMRFLVDFENLKKQYPECIELEE